MIFRTVPFVPILLYASCTFAQVSETPSRTIRTGKAEVMALCVAPKGDRLLVGLNDGAALVDIATGKKVYPFTFAEDGGAAAYHVGFNENGEFAVLIGHSGKRTVWNTATGKQDKIINPHRWIPDARTVKAMGLDMSNSTFDRFYQQKQVRLGDLLVRAVKNGAVEFVDTAGKVTRTISMPENTDQHHLAPLLLWENYLLVGTDNGNVLFYDVL
jgi:WD40 repeat protein